MKCLGHKVKVAGHVSNVPAIVLASWRSLSSADVMFRRQRSKGSWNYMETKPLLCSFPSLPVRMGHSCSPFSSRTRRDKERETDDMVRWVSKAWKTNSGMNRDTGKHLTSRPPLHPNHVLQHPPAHVYLQKKSVTFRGIAFFKTHSWTTQLLSDDSCPHSFLQFTQFLSMKTGH